MRRRGVFVRLCVRLFVCLFVSMLVVFMSVPVCGQTTPDLTPPVAPVPVASETPVPGLSDPATLEKARIARSKRARSIDSARHDLVLARIGASRSQPRVATALRALGYAYELDRRYFSAVDAYVDAIRVDEAGQRWRDYAVDVAFAGRIAWALQRYELAQRFYNAGLSRLEHAGDWESPLANECRLGLARVAILHGRWKFASTLIEHSLNADATYRPWDDGARAADLIARGDLEIARQQYGRGLFDLERGEVLETRSDRAVGVAYTPDVAPGLSAALAGLGSSWTALTVAALSEDLLFANESYREAPEGLRPSPQFNAVEVAANRANAATGVDQQKELIAHIAGMRHFDAYVQSTGVTTAYAYRNLGDASFAKGDYAGAATEYLAARGTLTNALGASFPERGELDGMLARAALGRGRARDAIALLKTALREEAAYGFSEGPVAQLQTRVLAEAEDADGRVADAASDYARSFRLIRRVLASSDAFLTERQRLRYLNVARITIDRYDAFLLSRRPPGAAATLYDVTLLGKDIVAGSLASLSASISDPGLRALRARLAQNRRLVSEHDYGRNGSFLAEAVAETAEADLVETIERRSSPVVQRPVLWRDVRAALGPHDAAVEYVRVGDSYFALVITARSVAPVIATLGSTAGITKAVERYASAVEPGATIDPEAQRALYDRVWEPLVVPLARATRVYLAPDGALDQIAFAILQRPDGRDLLDVLDLRQMTSTKDLLESSELSTSRTAAIFADPAFDERVASDEKVPSPESFAEVIDASKASPARMVADVPDETRIGVRGGSLRPLPETEDELRSVATTLHDHGWSIEAYHGATATKPALETIAHPRILHVATHGYVLRDIPDTDPRYPHDYEDPMQRSMLFLSGGGRTWSKADPPNSGLDNGVFTAYEASSLDLHGTELVVLSACETGLGKFEGGEGVLGLRRAFQRAGAQFVLSTLWQIPSDDTVGLLDLFYKNWLGGENKYDALRDAQRTVRARAVARTGHDDPRAWGAFVLVGNGHG